MKPLIKFVKGNLVPLICGIVALLALGAIWWPIGAWKEDLQSRMKERADEVQIVQQMASDITLPGGQILKNATYEPNVIAAAKNAEAKMSDQAKQIIARAAQQNQRGRVLPGADGKLIPLLAGKPEENFLPKISPGALPYAFLVDYNRIFKGWVTQLVGNETASPVPPTTSEIQADFTNEQKRAAQPINKNPMFADAAPASTPGAPDATYIRAALSRRASEIKMYVDPTALYKRPWATGSVPPNEAQIFEGIVDSWFQQDVINAIAEMNKGSTNVGQSPVKRLYRIVPGVQPNVLQPAGPGTSLFLSASSGPGSSVATGIDISRDLTGRIGSPQYDVVVTFISLDLDPSYENAFFDALYRQNNGYTVLNVNTRVLDPFETSSNGYLYGNVQAVHLDIMVEGLMYRSWTVPLMPDYTRQSLGIPLLPPTP